ncbi:hypothetical protein BJ912DRAFT_513200 [Pholiota molesta]|nr:hypothetical protein BJ912DRAFT_513200 [Pholiota molesta]
MPLQPLSSPIHLADSCFAPPPPAYTPIASRTRSKAAAQSRRRRLAPRFDLPPSHAFDDLPWIATLDAAPELLNPWDIADLSLISDSSEPLSSSGPGPVRRRKTSLRSSPITSAKNNHSPGPSPPRETFIPPAQFVSTTPTRSRFIPSRVLFHNLMPVVSCDFGPERSHSCITRSRINF